MPCSQDGQCDCRPFCAIPYATALGWPKNIGHATAPHQAMLARFAQQAARIVALSGTGEELTADLVVVEGHKHNSEETLVEWRQLGAWPILGRTLAGVARVGQLVTLTATEDLGLYLFKVPLDPFGVRVRSVLFPRFRATVPNPGTPGDSTLTVTGDLVRIVAGVLTVVAALPRLNIVAQAGPPLVSYVNQWFSWGGIEIPPTVTEALFALRLRVKMAVAAQQGVALEVAVGLRSGL